MSEVQVETQLHFLGLLEDQETRLLSWGLTDGGFSEEELISEIDAFSAEQNLEAEPEDFLDALIDHHLLFELDATGGRVFRTRMAEGVRLFARLRQLFPKRAWRSAPALVADYRLLIRPRAYPIRTVEPSDALLEIKSSSAISGFRRQVLARLLEDDGRSLLLSPFQVKATAHILAGLDERRTGGTVISAGTGSGKTLAFYLPAISHIATKIDDKAWTKALAIYPRQELLKDQFSETYTEARRIDSVLIESGRRRLTIGAYFGGTPYSPAHALKIWEHIGQDAACPYLPCPVCGGTLLWQKSDIDKKEERLVCRDQACGTVVTADEVTLTRAAINRRPPDILFTTTEMLNRKMGDSVDGHVFGVGSRAPRKPELLLLDEIHTYSGVSGAQVAHLIRRWRHACRAPLQIVGLSATLREAESFFARLVGLSETQVAKVEPSPHELEHEGKEYLLALRGDPVSGTSLLSTTIQASMLLRRVLDPYDIGRSEGAYGQKVFVFTDDLDVTNRLYYNILDAEGLDSWGKPEKNESLAALRSPARDERPERLAAGQSWDLCEQIGHQLGPGNHLRIGRTSSQDVGVQTRGDIVVATASLEVGFNDPHVGAVIQHKSPRTTSQFLQRKGRAARARQMRPWTVVVLSDYGRDRLTYQGYELLFDPELEPNPLPVSNRYVLRMQAAFSLMDWVATQMKPSPTGSVWRDFAGPGDPATSWGRDTAARQDQQISILSRLLEDAGYRALLASYIEASLQLAPPEVVSLLWEPPRALITNVIPTILRRLRSGWGRAPVRESESAQDRIAWDHPLPDFVPKQLFSDLNLPEVAIRVPSQQKGEAEEEHTMPVAQALREFAPGRVSRRFGIRHEYVRHWVGLPGDGESDRQDLLLAAYGPEYDELGAFDFRTPAGAAVKIRCVRPWKIVTANPSAQVTDSSNAFLDWKTQILPEDEGLALELPDVSSWTGLLKDVRFYTHNRRSGIEVRRFALGSHASVSFRDGRRLETYVRFTDEATGFDDEAGPVAVGYPLNVDGFVLRFQLPVSFDVFDLSGADLRSFRTAYFLHSVRSEPKLQQVNSFQLDWLAQVYLSALVQLAAADGIDLQQAHERLHGSGIGDRLKGVLEVIFQALPVAEGTGEGKTEAEAEPEQDLPRLQKMLRDLGDDAHVMETLSELAPLLWEDPDNSWTDWARLRFKSTLGAAVVQACQQLCPEYDASDLTVDIDPGPRDDAPVDLEEVWLTESTMGGGGLVEEVWRRAAPDPRRFLRLIQAALEPGDFELVDSELGRLLRWLHEDNEVRDEVQAVREHRSHAELRERFDRLLRTLGQRGLFMSHSVVAALNTRILRSGSAQSTDQLLWELTERWGDAEEKLGVEIDARVFAYLNAGDKALDQALGQPAPTGDPKQWRFGAIYSMLWPRGHQVRAQSLFAYNPFSTLPPSDRILVLSQIHDPYPTVSLGGETWQAEVTDALVKQGACTLIAEAAHLDRLKSAIHSLMAAPIDAGYLFVYPRVEAVQRVPGKVAVRFDLREAIL